MNSRGFQLLVVLSLGLGGTSGCLLFTDTFNQPPKVSIEGPPGPLYRGQPGTFRARVANDEAASYAWGFVPVCPDSVDAAEEARRQGAGLGPSSSDAGVLIRSFPTAQQGCIFVIVVDRDGARTFATQPVTVRARELVIKGPSQVERGLAAVFTAAFADEPGGQAEFRWSHAYAAAGTKPADACAQAEMSPGDKIAEAKYQLIPGKQPFCVVVTAHDKWDVDTTARLEIPLVVSKGPVAKIRVIAPASGVSATKPSGLFTFFRLSALLEGETAPEPGTTFTWTLTGPGPEALMAAACPNAAVAGAADGVESCFTAVKAGAYQAMLTVSENGMTATDTLAVTVEDVPPCIRETVPNVSTAPRIISFYDQQLVFRVLEVGDDADPVPSAGRSTEGAFSWSRRLLGDADFSSDVGSNFPEFTLSGRDFKAGDQVEVRVQYKDRFDRANPGARDAGMRCKPNDATCEVVPGSGCFQRLTWVVVYL